MLLIVYLGNRLSHGEIHFHHSGLSLSFTLAVLMRVASEAVSEAIFTGRILGRVLGKEAKELSLLW